MESHGGKAFVEATTINKENRREESRKWVNLVSIKQGPKFNSLPTKEKKKEEKEKKENTEDKKEEIKGSELNTTPKASKNKLKQVEKKPIQIIEGDNKEERILDENINKIQEPSQNIYNKSEEDDIGREFKMEFKNIRQFNKYLQIINAPGDGACLFNSISYLTCEGNYNFSLDIRKKIVNFMKTTKTYGKTL